MSDDVQTRLTQIRQRLGDFGKLQGPVMQGFHGAHQSMGKDSALSSKIKELIALAIAVHTGCDDCIAMHVHSAIEAGASREEVGDALGVATVMGGGPALMRSTDALEVFEALQGSGG